MQEDTQTIIKLVLMAIALVLLIVLSATFSACETSLTSVTKFKFDTHYKKHKKNLIYKMCLRLINNYQMSLSTILISNTLVNVACSTLSTLFFTDLLLYCNVNDAISVATGVATGVITFLVLVFGEFIPKSIARKNSLKCLQILSPLVYILYFIFWPLSWLLCKFIKEKDTKSATEQELDTLIDIASNEGTIGSTEASLLSNALKFDDTRIESVLIPIKKVATIDIKWSKQKILDTFQKTALSRLLVKDKNKYIGVLNFKRFMLALSQNKNTKLLDMIDPVLFISKYDTLDKVLQMMQIQHAHLVAVKKNNNSSVVEGIVTMEDLIEELVGEIYDESDPFKNVSVINDFTWIVRGTYNAKKFNDAYLKIDSLKIDKELDVKSWLEETLHFKKFNNNVSKHNDLIKVTISRKRNGPISFIIEKKVTIY